MSSRYLTYRPSEAGGSELALKPGAYARIEAIARKGHSYGAIAKALGIGRDTFREIRKRDPKAQEACDLGKDADESRLIDIFQAHIAGGNLTAAIWYSKARHGWTEHPADQGPVVAIQIALPRPMENEAYIKMITAQAEEVPQ